MLIELKNKAKIVSVKQQIYIYHLVLLIGKKSVEHNYFSTIESKLC